MVRPFDRLLAHAVCQFYGLHAHSAELAGCGKCVLADWRPAGAAARAGAAAEVSHTRAG
ncbi:hypothetical protein T492DRAFT_874843 [Pavlovales sp. CCMP2436]|nr:hypothetical protein T492DRAFT_874843 [Pavlovales sp. CCMP2436]